MSEYWLDIQEVLPFGLKVSDEFFTRQTDGGVLMNEFGIQLCNVEGDREQEPEASISELESLLLMDSNGEVAIGTGELSCHNTVDIEETDSVHDGSTVSQFDVVDHIMVEEESPATVSSAVDEDLSSEEDDRRDITWSYHNEARRRGPHCRGRRRTKPGRRLSMGKHNAVVDERKKQQNKTAATRYREKKRSEEIENEMMCAELEKRNEDLRTRVQDMTQQVAVLRQLVIDIFRSTNIRTD